MRSGRTLGMTAASPWLTVPFQNREGDEPARKRVERRGGEHGLREVREAETLWTTPYMSAAYALNWEQFGNRDIPFFGDYNYISAVGATVLMNWTDGRDTVPGTDPRYTNGDGTDGFDVLQCRAQDSSGVWSPTRARMPEGSTSSSTAAFERVVATSHSNPVRGSVTSEAADNSCEPPPPNPPRKAAPRGRFASPRRRRRRPSPFVQRAGGSLTSCPCRPCHPACRHLRAASRAFRRRSPRWSGCSSRSTQRSAAPSERPSSGR